MNERLAPQPDPVPDEDPPWLPAHYKALSPEPLEVIEAWGLGFHAGNVLKYLARYPYRGRPLEDLRKASCYLNRLIEIEEGKQP